MPDGVEGGGKGHVGEGSGAEGKGRDGGSSKSQGSLQQQFLDQNNVSEDLIDNIAVTNEDARSRQRMLDFAARRDWACLDWFPEPAHCLGFCGHEASHIVIRVSLIVVTKNQKRMLTLRLEEPLATLLLLSLAPSRTGEVSALRRRLPVRVRLRRRSPVFRPSRSLSDALSGVRPFLDWAKVWWAYTRRRELGRTLMADDNLQNQERIRGPD
ncbi:hypothetical protein Taro_018934 [Colocasia esculenta]|uniref:Uncharacterized protein n=1 Tax=Colocasia esculenta TaxID=4460 RepID=A0A843UVB0_COLES|nr:hypothetical protein [Colocasia esculenta]